LQGVNDLDLGRVPHLSKSDADIARHIGKEMRKAVVKDIVLKQNKVPVIIDE
jgi:hypothetical protein